MDKEISSLNFRHSISITHHSSLNFSHLFGNITLFSSLNIFHTIYGSHTCYIFRAFLFCYPCNIFIPSKLCLFSFPLSLQPCHSPKAETQTQTQTQTHKNFSSSLAASRPSPGHNTELSNVHGEAISFVVTHFSRAQHRTLRRA